MPVTTDAEAATPPGGRQRNENGELEERQTEPLRTPRPGEQSPHNTAGAGLLQVLTLVLVHRGVVSKSGAGLARKLQKPSGGAKVLLQVKRVRETAWAAKVAKVKLTSLSRTSLIENFLRLRRAHRKFSSPAARPL